MRRRTSAGFTNAHTDARQQQLYEVSRETGKGCHHAPYRQGNGDHISPVPFIRESGDGNAQRDIKNSKGEAG